MRTINDMTGGTIYFSTSDGMAWKAFEGIKEASITCSDAISEFSHQDIIDSVAMPLEFMLQLKMSDETRARMLGFKNYNCYSRSIRRMKRRKEKERRRRLKGDSKNMAERQ